MASAGDLASVGTGAPAIDGANPALADLASGLTLGGADMSAVTDMAIATIDLMLATTSDLASACTTSSCKSNPPGIAACKVACGTVTATCLNGFCAP
jgi:hypothetical protein